MSQCICGSQKEADRCCAVFISGAKNASTPEELMRSRYTAFTQVNIAYIVRTMKGPAAQRFDHVESLHWTSKVTWLRLEIISTKQESADKGFVEFLVHFEQDGQRHILHELSEFHLENGVWYYVDGIAPKKIPASINRIGRNDPCICGSGKKHKKCCGIVS